MIGPVRGRRPLKGYGVGGVLALMIRLLVVQIIVVWAWGIEPARRGLEHLFGTAA